MISQVGETEKNPNNIKSQIKRNNWWSSEVESGVYGKIGKSRQKVLIFRNKIKCHGHVMYTMVIIFKMFRDTNTVNTTVLYI